MTSHEEFGTCSSTDNDDGGGGVHPCMNERLTERERLRAECGRLRATARATAPTGVPMEYRRSSEYLRGEVSGGSESASETISKAEEELRRIGGTESDRCISLPRRAGLGTGLHPLSHPSGVVGRKSLSLTDERCKSPNPIVNPNAWF